MTPRWQSALLVGSALIVGCDASSPSDETTPEEIVGTCYARVDGNTVDIIDVDDVASGASIAGSTLGMGCGENTQTATGSSSKQILSFEIKAFDGAGEYTIDDTETFGDVRYNGNDDTTYSTFKPSTGGRDSSCTISVTEADDARVTGTFTCTDLHGYINDAGGACCDSVYVNVTEGTFDLPL